MYTTEALVCGSRDSNTSDRSYLLFTREAGMVWAMARSVREERSKQRYALQDHSLVRVSLVRGKSGWRIGSVEPILNPYLSAADRIGRAGVVALVKFLRRFVHGEWAHPVLFDDVAFALPRLASTTDLDQSELLTTVFEARALYTLGYLASSDMLQPIISPVAIQEVLDNSPALNELLIKQLTHAKNVSHL